MAVGVLDEPPGGEFGEADGSEVGAKDPEQAAEGCRREVNTNMGRAA